MYIFTIIGILVFVIAALLTALIAQIDSNRRLRKTCSRLNQALDTTTAALNRSTDIVERFNDIRKTGVEY